jgi:hypothetical protein
VVLLSMIYQRKGQRIEMSRSYDVEGSIGYLMYFVMVAAMTYIHYVSVDLTFYMQFG